METEVPKKEQWLRNNIKPLKYIFAGATFAAMATIGVLQGDTDTLKYAFFVAAMAYTSPTIVQTSLSIDKECAKYRSGEIEQNQRTPGTVMFAKHALEPVTDVLKLGLNLLKPKRG